jgi:D-glycero-alpha-D-manno-heptose-7-phosphate kinase
VRFILTRTPFRVSFFGGGTDYPEWYMKEGGAVLSTTIDKYMYISCRHLPPFAGIRHRIVWRHVELVDSISEILHPAVREGLRYLGFDESVRLELHYQADLPARSGMGSSSAFAVGLIKGLLALREEAIDKHSLARRAIDLEQNWMKEAVGSQDQIAAAYGGLNLVEFMPGGEFNVSRLELPPEQESALVGHLMLVHVGSNRIAADIARNVIENMSTRRRSLTRMREMVNEAATALKKGDLDAIGHLLDEGWSLKRSLSDLVSNNAVDEVYDVARKHGALGGKLLGAGGTGFMLLFVRPADRDRVLKALPSRFQAVPFRIDRSGCSIIYQADPD